MNRPQENTMLIVEVMEHSHGTSTNDVTTIPNNRQRYRKTQQDDDSTPPKYKKGGVYVNRRNYPTRSPVVVEDNNTSNNGNNGDGGGPSAPVPSPLPAAAVSPTSIITPPSPTTTTTSNTSPIVTSIIDEDRNAPTLVPTITREPSTSFMPTSKPYIFTSHVNKNTGLVVYESRCNVNDSTVTTTTDVVPVLISFDYAVTIVSTVSTTTTTPIDFNATVRTIEEVLHKQLSKELIQDCTFDGTREKNFEIMSLNSSPEDIVVDSMTTTTTTTSNTIPSSSCGIGNGSGSNSNSGSGSGAMETTSMNNCRIVHGYITASVFYLVPSPQTRRHERYRQLHIQQQQQQQQQQQLQQQGQQMQPEQEWNDNDQKQSDRLLNRHADTVGSSTTVRQLQLNSIVDPTVSAAFGESIIQTFINFPDKSIQLEYLGITNNAAYDTLGNTADPNMPSTGSTNGSSSGSGSSTGGSTGDDTDVSAAVIESQSADPTQGRFTDIGWGATAIGIAAIAMVVAMFLGIRRVRTIRRKDSNNNNQRLRNHHNNNIDVDDDNHNHIDDVDIIDNGGDLHPIEVISQHKRSTVPLPPMILPEQQQQQLQQNNQQKKQQYSLKNNSSTIASPSSINNNNNNNGNDSFNDSNPKKVIYSASIIEVNKNYRGTKNNNNDIDFGDYDNNDETGFETPLRTAVVTSFTNASPQSSSTNNYSNSNSNNITNTYQIPSTKQPLFVPTHTDTSKDELWKQRFFRVRSNEIIQPGLSSLPTQPPTIS